MGEEQRSEEHPAAQRAAVGATRLTILILSPDDGPCRLPAAIPGLAIIGSGLGLAGGSLTQPLLQFLSRKRSGKQIALPHRIALFAQ